MDYGNRKFIIIGIAIVLLMMAVIAASANDTNDPKELVKMAFISAIREIEHAISQSSTLQVTAKDRRAAQALKMCKSLLNTSIDDLKRSLQKFDGLDIANMEEYVADIKVWVSGALTYQDTCRDGFKNTTGDTGKRMNKILKLGGQLTSNVLAMVNNFSEHHGERVQLIGVSRRILDKNLSDEHAWWSRGHRRLLLDVDPTWLTPNATVAQDGSGTFTTIMDVITTIPQMNTQPFVILIKQGIYYEYVDIPRYVNNVVFIGEGPTKTIITGNKNYDDGYATFFTATVAVNGDGFMAMNIGFENTAGPEKHQAVALRISGDMAIMYNCAMEGYQDTLYTHSYRQFYRQCIIRGTVDFIFGNAAAVLQECKMIVRKPLIFDNVCTVTAQGRKDPTSQGGLILQACYITADPDYLTTDPLPITYLGRPWKMYSRTIIMQSFIDWIVDPKGWAPWAGSFGLNTCYYSEYYNRGPGSDTSQRVTWKGIKKIGLEEATSYAPGEFIQGDLWIQETGVPYISGMMDG